MREIMIDCAEISTSRSLHNAFAEALSFPEWYGKNLDALHDCLTGISEETHLTVANLSNLGRFSVGFRRVLRDSEEENANLKVSLI